MNRIKFLKLCCAASALMLSGNHSLMATSTEVVNTMSEKFPNLTTCMQALWIAPGK